MDLISIFLIVTGVTNIFLTLVTYFNTKEITRINLSFSLIALNVAFWSLSMAYFREAPTTELSFSALKILYSIPIFIPILFLYFVFLFNNEGTKIKHENKVIGSLILWSIFLLANILGTKNFIHGVSIPDLGEKIIEFGRFYTIYIVHFIVFFGTSFYILIDKYLKSKDENTKGQIKFLFLGTLISSFIGMTTNLIMPWFGYFDLNWLGNITTIFFVGFILYAILKYQLFDTKIIATEIFIIFLTVTMISDLFFTKSNVELTIKSFIMFSVATMGYFIVKGMRKEIKAREEIQKLADQLQHANAHLVKMDKQKSEFVSIASHQLRAPIASLKGYSSMALEGSYGKMSDEIKEVVSRIFQSSQSLALIIDDFLNLSRIERGKIEYAFAEANVKDIIEKVISETAPSAETKGIKISLKSHRGNFSANIDAEKIKQVVSNLIDNALKYTPKGSIKIDLSGEGDKIVIKISDTGIGISKENILRLFRKFKRLDNANTGSIKGTGLGLYLAKEIVNAHEGQIWAESKGEGKGTTFCVELKK